MSKKEKKDSNEMDNRPSNFITDIIDNDMKTNRFKKLVHTRFPPEPNGYLHLGHATSICLNYGIAAAYNGKFNLRFDDTNPTKEETEYVDSIINDVRWLGADFEDRLFYASDYFEKMYEYALRLIKAGMAYVCDLSADELATTRGTLIESGKESPYRARTVQENLDLFERMRKGEFADGAKTLRAKIDMNSPNMNLRDPVMYRIIHTHHFRQGDKWCIYPSYDWAHGFEDSIEGITHSICTLEFENHRPLYDWFIDAVNATPGEKIHHPQQIEFGRINLNYTVTSKRKLLQLVKEGHVRGWDDPRMPTVAAARRRGVTAEAIRKFAVKAGIAKREKTVDMSVLDACIREDLEERCPRVMGVLSPLRVVITNYPENKTEELVAPYHPTMPEMGSRKLLFSRVLYIEQEDFMEDPPKKFFRLAPGREIRLRYAYFIKCTNVVKDSTGKIVELQCTYDPETRGGNAPDGRKVKATIHWVAEAHALKAEGRLYDRLFTKEDPSEGTDNFATNINPNSLKIVSCFVEPSLKTATPGMQFQFERVGYFCVDSDSKNTHLVFNRTISLVDTWAKIKQTENG